MAVVEIIVASNDTTDIIREPSQALEVYFKRGDTGPQGAQGPQGLKGDTGLTGPAGTNGTNGTNSAEGPQGPQGDTGPKGDTGLTGFAWDTGRFGANGYVIGDIVNYLGNYYICLANNDALIPTSALGVYWNPYSFVGPAGNDGINGAEGPQGPQGDPGSQGLTGDTGLTGPKGDTGDPGAAGTAGTNGTNGTNGATGAQGTSGVVNVSPPIVNTGTSTSAIIGINQTLIGVAQSQVTNLTTDLEAKQNSVMLINSQHTNQSVIDVFPRSYGVGNTLTLTSGTAYFMCFTPNVGNNLVQTVQMVSSGIAASALTLARIGLYTITGNTLLLVAQTDSDTTLFTAINTIYTRTFSTVGGYPSSYNIVAGQRYALAVLCVGTTMPQLACGPSLLSTVANMTPRMNTSKTAQTDLPTVQGLVGGQFPQQIFGRML